MLQVNASFAHRLPDFTLLVEHQNESPEAEYRALIGLVMPTTASVGIEGIAALEIVFARALDDDGIAHKESDYSMQ